MQYSMILSQVRGKNQHHPQSLEALKEIITQEFEALTPDMTSRLDNYRGWLNQYINNGGSRLSDLLFKTQ